MVIFGTHIQSFIVFIIDIVCAYNVHLLFPWVRIRLFYLSSNTIHKKLYQDTCKCMTIPGHDHTFHILLTKHIRL